MESGPPEQPKMMHFWPICNCSRNFILLSIRMPLSLSYSTWFVLFFQLFLVEKKEDVFLRVFLFLNCILLFCKFFSSSMIYRVTLFPNLGRRTRLNPSLQSLSLSTSQEQSHFVFRFCNKLKRFYLCRCQLCRRFRRKGRS